MPVSETADLPGYWIVEFYPTNGRFIAHGPHPTEAALNEDLAHLIEQSMANGATDQNSDIANVRVGKFKVEVGGPSGIAQAKARGMDDPDVPEVDLGA